MSAPVRRGVCSVVRCGRVAQPGRWPTGRCGGGRPTVGGRGDPHMGTREEREETGPGIRAHPPVPPATGYASDLYGRDNLGQP